MNNLSSKIQHLDNNNLSSKIQHEGEKTAFLKLNSMDLQLGSDDKMSQRRIGQNDFFSPSFFIPTPKFLAL